MAKEYSKQMFYPIEITMKEGVIHLLVPQILEHESNRMVMIR